MGRNGKKIVEYQFGRDDGSRNSFGHGTRKWNPRMSPYISTKYKGSALIAVRNPQTIPTAGQNFFEYVLEFIRDVSKTQIGEEYGPWVPFIGTMFLFIFVSNWSGALLPWKIIQLPHGELAAPTNDINTTVASLAHVSSIFLCRSF
ncbi:hypothetical protein QYF36_019150 [Acer negundo]|nr:hypothetical protein QYF36_019150 [Acer negundo]